MSQSIQNLTGKSFSDLLITLKSEAEFAHKHNAYVSSIACAVYPTTFGIEINAVVVYSEGDFEQDFVYLSAKSLRDLKGSIDKTATQMALIGYEIAAITHSTIPTSKLYRTAEAIVIFNKRK